MVDSAKGKAEDVRAGFDTLRVLVDAVDTQLGFFIREKGMFGPYRELIRSHALDIQTMLGVILHEVSAFTGFWGSCGAVDMPGGLGFPPQ